MKKIILLFLTILLSIPPLCAQKKWIFLDVFNYPLYINGLYVGKTNQPICLPTSSPSFEVIIKRGKHYYGRTINVGHYHSSEIDVSAAPRIQKPLYLSEIARGAQKTKSKSSNSKKENKNNVILYQR